MKHLNIVLFFCILAFTQALINSPQVLIQTLSEYFSITPQRAVLVMSLTTFPLGFFALIFGILLMRINSIFALRFAVVCVFLMQFLTIFALLFDLFWVILCFRFAQGLCFAVILTILWTFTQKRNATKMIGIYVALIIISGVSSRILSGFISANFGIEVVFVSFCLISVLLLFCAFALDKSFLDFSSLNNEKIILRANDVNAKNLILFLCVFLMYFSFSSIINSLSIRVRLAFGGNDFLAAISYIGYSLGIFISLFTPFLQKIFKGSVNAVICGFIAMILALFMLNSSSFIEFCFAVCLLCAGMFLITTHLSVLNSQNITFLKSGLYLCFYYTGGALGAYVGAFIVNDFGWHSLMQINYIVLILGFILALFLKFRN